MTSSAVRRMNVDEAFREFVKASDLPLTLGSFDVLCQSVGLPSSVLQRRHETAYSTLRNEVKADEAKGLWRLLDARASQDVYSAGQGGQLGSKACKNMTVLIVGAGPCGLRMSIECALLGAWTVVVEKRPYFARNNVLHVWPFAMTDLKDLGAKTLCPKFGAGCLDNISTKKLQLLLLKVALLLGVEVHTPAEFVGLLEPEKGNKWKVNFGSKAPALLKDSCFDVVIGADGRHQTVPGFPQKFENSRKKAIAVTANFTNRKTKAEMHLAEIPGITYFFYQDFFNCLKGKTGIDLENFVYYKDDTHYFVMCVKKASLLLKGVIKKDNNDVSALLAPGNINQSALLSFAREATVNAVDGIPTDLEFAKNHRGEDDVAVFDFTNVYHAENSCCVKERNGQRLLLCCIGDALSQPFWPTGTGIAKGFLGVFDAAWLIRNWALEQCSSAGSGDKGKQRMLELVAERENIYKLLSQTKPDTLRQQFNKFTIDPQTRYKVKITLTTNLKMFSHLYETAPKKIDAVLQKRKTDEEDCGPKKKASPDVQSLLAWYQQRLASFSDIAPVADLYKSWLNGLAFCALAQLYRPNLVDLKNGNKAEILESIRQVFELNESEFDVPRMLVAEDFIGTSRPDPLSLISYLFQLRIALANEPLPGEEKNPVKRKAPEADSRSAKFTSATRKLQTIRRMQTDKSRLNEDRSWNNYATLGAGLTLGAFKTMRPPKKLVGDYGSMPHKAKRFKTMKKSYRLMESLAHQQMPSLAILAPLAVQRSREGTLKPAPSRLGAVRRQTSDKGSNILNTSDTQGSDICVFPPSGQAAFAFESSPTTESNQSAPKPVPRRPRIAEAASADEDHRQNGVNLSGPEKRPTGPEKSPINVEKNPKGPEKSPKGPEKSPKDAKRSPKAPAVLNRYQPQSKEDEARVESSPIHHHPSLMYCSGVAANRLKIFDNSGQATTATPADNTTTTTNPTEKPKPAPRKPPRSVGLATVDEQQDSCSGKQPPEVVPPEVIPLQVVTPEDIPPKVVPRKKVESHPETDKALSFKLGELILQATDENFKSFATRLCCVCSEHLYVVDKRAAHGCFFHSACFKCVQCDAPLDVDSSHVRRDENNKVQFYCAPHFYDPDGSTLNRLGTVKDKHPNKDTSRDTTDESTESIPSFRSDRFNTEMAAQLPQELWLHGPDSADEDSSSDDDDDDVSDDDDNDDDNDKQAAELIKYRNCMSMRMIVEHDLQVEMKEVEDEQRRLDERGRIIEQTMNQQRQSRLSAVEVMDNLTREWLNVLSSKVELNNSQSAIMLRARLMKLKEQEQELCLQLNLIQETENYAEDADWIEEDLAKLTEEIADLQDFLDITQQFPD